VSAYRTTAARDPEPEHWLNRWEREHNRRLRRTCVICGVSGFAATTLLNLLLGWPW
jgi:hypothetical protein